MNTIKTLLNGRPKSLLSKMLLASVSSYCSLFIIQSAFADIPASAYVQDGLVACFDGIENAGAGQHSSDLTEWANLATADGKADNAHLSDGSYTVKTDCLSFVKGRMVASNLVCATSTTPITLQARVKATAAPTGSYDLPFIDVSSRGHIGFDARTGNGYSYSQPNSSSWGSQISIYKWWGNFNFSARAYDPHTVTTIIPVSSVADGSVGKVYQENTVQAYKSKWESGVKAAPSGNVYFGCTGVDYDIYSARVYNRELTTAEIARNVLVDRARFDGLEGCRYKNDRLYVRLVVDGSHGISWFRQGESEPTAKLELWVEYGSTASFKASVTKGFSITGWTGGAPTYNDVTGEYEITVSEPTTVTATVKTDCVELVDLTAAARKKGTYREISASTTTNILYPETAAFDGSTSGNSRSVWYSKTEEEGADLSNTWIQHRFTDSFEPGKSIVVVTYRIYGVNNGDSLNNRPKTWEFLGSNTGEEDSWTVLDTQTNNWTTGTQNFQCKVLQPFRYFRLRMTSVKNATQYKLNEVAFFGVVGDTDPFAGYRFWVGDATGDWYDGANWTGGSAPQAGEKVLILSGNTVSITNSTVKVGAVYLKGTLLMQGWDAALNADTVEVQSGGSITCAACTQPGEATNRVHVVCDDLVVEQGGSVTAASKGYAKQKGPGASTIQRAGASHGGPGGGAYRNTNFIRTIYGDEEWPESIGSGGWNAASPGGGVVRIDAAKTVVVNGTVSAAGGNSVDYNVYNSGGSCHGAGAGGSVLINCTDFAGTGGKVTAMGGGGRCVLSGTSTYQETMVSGPGGGGRIAIHKSSSRPAAISNVTFTAAPGDIHGGTYTGAATYFDSKVTYEDRYFTDGGLGSLWFSDRSFLAALKGDGELSGRLCNLPNPITFDAIDFRKGHLAFSAIGTVVNVTGDLTVTSADARLELGGAVVSNRTYRTDYYSGAVPLHLNVGGDLRLVSGGRLDVRSAAVNAEDAAVGAYVNVAGDISVASNSSIYAWSDVETGYSPAFFAANVFVATGAVVSADCRGFGGGWSLSNTTQMRKNGYGPGASRPPSSGNDTPVPGGGHGGRGGQTNYVDRGGLTYDDAYRPQLAGSGGAALRKWELFGGNGGGVISLTATNSIVIDGKLTANGELSVGGSTGGGAGGTIYLSAPAVYGCELAVISAKGGSASANKVYGGTGGGGRIGVWTGYGWSPDTGPSSQIHQKDVPLIPWNGNAKLQASFSVDAGTNTQSAEHPEVLGLRGTIWFTDVTNPRGFMLIVK